jgi:hypothetical protein
VTVKCSDLSKSSGHSHMDNVYSMSVEPVGEKCLEIEEM